MPIRNPDQILDALSELSAALRVEREEELLRFTALVKGKTLTQRVTQGITWYPLSARRSGFVIGKKAFVEVEIEKRPEQHQFRTGHIVQLFKQEGHHSVAGPQGVVHYIDGPRMKIVLYGEDLPEHMDRGLWGVDMVFDDRTYREMEAMLQHLRTVKGSRLADLRDVMWERFPAGIIKPKTEFVSAALNKSQLEAMQGALGASDFCIIHGPPGTGKTTTLVELVVAMKQEGRSVLVSAPSNVAADLLAERLNDRGLRIVRLGNVSRVHERLISLTIDAQVADHPDHRQLNKIKHEAADMRRRAGKLHFRERKEMMIAAKDLEHWSYQLERRLVDDVLDMADVIVCTLTGAGLSIIEHMTFDTVVIDEAGQALEPAAWIAIAKGKRVILAGDPYQLPPTVKSAEAVRKGLATTLLDRLLHVQDHVFLLKTQYRMHPAIMGFSNVLLYNGQLECADLIGQRLPLQTQLQNVVFIDTAGCGFDEMVNTENLSKFNPEEFFLLREHLYRYITTWPEEGYQPSIGIISPYREQVVFMENMLRGDKELAGKDIEVKTIDGFQGQERDIIYISLVRSNTRQEIGFLSDRRRLNVALTRARFHVVIIGDSGTVGNHELYRDLIAYCESQPDGYESGWAYMSV
jgi:ATP-dependent RNA/DNA helicase IGHMBP2